MPQPSPPIIAFRVRIASTQIRLAKINLQVGIHASVLNEILDLVGSDAGVALVPTDLNLMQSSGVKFLKLRRLLAPAAIAPNSAVRSERRKFLVGERVVSVTLRARTVKRLRLGRVQWQAFGEATDEVRVGDELLTP